MKVPHITFHLVANKRSLHWLVGDIDCLKHLESNSVMGANTFSMSPLIAQIRWKARTALEMETTEIFLLQEIIGFFIVLWTYCRSSHDIPSYRLCNKFVVLYRLGLRMEKTNFIEHVVKKDCEDILPMNL